MRANGCDSDFRKASQRLDGAVQGVQVLEVQKGHDVLGSARAHLGDFGFARGPFVVVALVEGKVRDADVVARGLDCGLRRRIDVAGLSIRTSTTLRRTQDGSRDHRRALGRRA